MATDKFDRLGPIYAEIGGEIADIVGDPDGAYLYSEGGDGWCSYAIFKEEGEKVRYYRGTPELGDLIWDAWLTEDPDKRWSVMEYVVTGSKFQVQFQFPDQVDPKESEDERRPRALQKRFGDKPVIYPPIPSVD